MLRFGLLDDKQWVHMNFKIRGGLHLGPLGVQGELNFAHFIAMKLYN